MKKTRFAVFQNAVDKKYLEEAAGSTHKKSYSGSAALAACACIAILGVMSWRPWTKTKTADTYGLIEAPAAAYENAEVTADYEEAADLNTAETEAAVCEEECPAEAADDAFFAAAAPQMPIPKPSDNGNSVSVSGAAGYAVILPGTAEEFAVSTQTENEIEIRSVLFSQDGIILELKYAFGLKEHILEGNDEAWNASDAATVNNSPAQFLRSNVNKLLLVWTDMDSGLDLCLGADELPENRLLELAEQIQISIK